MPGIVIRVKIPTFRIVNAVLLGITILIFAASENEILNFFIVRKIEAEPNLNLSRLYENHKHFNFTYGRRLYRICTAKAGK